MLTTLARISCTIKNRNAHWLMGTVLFQGEFSSNSEHVDCKIAYGTNRICKPIKGYAIVEGRFLEITLSYKGINTWVALGLSPTGSMPNTDIYYCQNRENIIGVESAYASSRCKF